MSAAAGGYSPLSYHCGSVWPHDTAIAILGLYRAGLPEYAGGLIEGLLQASVTFEQRLPELWSGRSQSGAVRRRLPSPGVVGGRGRRGGRSAHGPDGLSRPETQDAPSMSSRRQA